MDGCEEEERKERGSERREKQRRERHKKGTVQSQEFQFVFFVLHPCGQGKSLLLKGPNLEVPSSFVDPVQDPGTKDALFQEECRQDPEFHSQVLGLERMLRVKAKKESTPVSDLPTSMSEDSAMTQLRAKTKDTSGDQQA